MFILKWPLELVGETQSVILPVGAVIVRVDVDGDDRVCLWTVSKYKAPEVSRDFVIVGTGTEWHSGWSYIGTARHELRYPDRGVFFWHVLELLS
jgi:hypothetical protein